MRRLTKSRSAKAGLPPGTFVHIGERKAEQVRITVMEYDEAQFREQQLATIEAYTPAAEPSIVTWINVDGLHQAEVLEALGERCGLHPLVVEDILNTDQRPKLEDYDDYLFIVLKSLYHAGGDSAELEIEQISLVLGSNYVLSFQERAGDEFEPIRERIRSSKGRVRKLGADYLAYSLIDAIVDQYFVVLEQIGERIEFMEEELVTSPTTETLHVIHEMKQELVFMRKSIWPLREVIGRLERAEPPLIQETTGIYLRDVYDHSIQIIDSVETFRDIVSGMLDIYLSSISNRMNEVMKVLTVIATIFIPLTFIVGVYGMNFHYMPELQWHWGYFTVWGVMIAIAIMMILYFRRRRWL
jgi:magnesium transporter